MLFKRIDLSSIPFGLAIAGEELKKGMLVSIALEKGQYVAKKATKSEEAYGFVTYRFESKSGNDKDFDTLKKGQRVVVYSLVNSNMWGTTEYTGTLAVGDFATVEDGKLKKTTDVTKKPLFEVAYTNAQGVGYTDATVDVRVIL